MMQSCTGKQNSISSRLVCLVAGGLFALACVLVFALPATAWAASTEYGLLTVETDGVVNTDYTFVKNTPDDYGGTLTVLTNKPITVKSTNGYSGTVINAKIVIDLGIDSDTAQVTLSNSSNSVNLKPKIGAAVEVKTGKLDLTANYLDIESAAGCAGIQNNGNSLLIKGGRSLTIKGGEGGAGIGGGRGQDGKNITIEMDKGMNGRTTIKGGEGSAGIGGGDGGSASNIVIGKWATFVEPLNLQGSYGIYGGKGAAGIGGGRGGYGGTSTEPLVIKESAVVKATGGEGGAGIGSGAKKAEVDTPGSHINILGVPPEGVDKGNYDLTVIARGGAGAAGIGGGKGLGTGSVVITGVQAKEFANDEAYDRVYVYGGSGGAAIGGGESGIGQGIKIESGYVKMEGGLRADGEEANAVSMGDGAGAVRPADTTFITNEISGGYIYGTAKSYKTMFTENTSGSNITKLTGGIYRVYSMYEGYDTLETSSDERQKGWPKNSVFGMPAAEGYETSGSQEWAQQPLYINKGAKPDFTLETGDAAKKAYNGSALLPEDVVSEAKRVNPFRGQDEGVNLSTDITFSYRLKTSTGAYNAGLPTDAGTYSIKAYLAKAKIEGKLTVDPLHPDYFTPAEVTTEFTIEKAPLTVTANDHAIAYGDAPAANGVAYAGFVNGETESVLGGALTYSFDYAQFGDVGNAYKITPAGLTANNYALTFVPGKLTVNKAPAPSVIPNGDLEVINGCETSYSFDLSGLLPTLGAGLKYGTVSYALGAINLGDYYTNGASVVGATLNLPIEAVNSSVEGKVGTVKAVVSSENFEDFTVEVAVEAVNREVLQGSPTLSKSDLTYGDKLLDIELSGVMQNKEGADVDGAFAWSVPETLPKAGTYQAVWTYVPDDMSVYAPATGTSAIAVAQKPVEITWDGYAERLYDGEKSKVTAVVSKGLIGDDKVGVEVQDGSKADAGTHTARAIALTGDDAGNYALPQNCTVEYVIKRSGSVIGEGDVKLFDDKGNPLEKEAAVVYGAGVVVKVKPTPTKEPAVAMLGRSAPKEPTANQMALYYGDVQVSDAVDAGEGGVYAITYDTGSNAVPVGSKVELTAKYVAGNMAAVQASVELTVAPKVVGLEWVGTTDRIAGDGKQVTAKATGLVGDDVVSVTVQGGDVSEVGTYTATAVKLVGEKAGNYLLPDNAATQFTIAAKPLPQPDPSGGGAKTLASTSDSAAQGAPVAAGLALFSAMLVLIARRWVSR